MLPWRRVDSTELPVGALELWRRDHEGRAPDYSMRIVEPGRPPTELMNSRQRASEEALAKHALEALGRRPQRVLIGGLGMGFTLSAALAEFPPTSSVVVAELFGAVVRWNHEHFAALTGGADAASGAPLEDPRVRVHVGDVRELYAPGSGGPFDIILLDTDNGPEGTTRSENEGLYGAKGLREAREALARGGILAVWSAFPSSAFTAELNRAGFDTRTLTARAHQSGRRARGARHTIWLARR